MGYGARFAEVMAGPRAQHSAAPWGWALAFPTGFRVGPSERTSIPVHQDDRATEAGLVAEVLRAPAAESGGVEREIDRLPGGECDACVDEWWGR